MIKFDDPALTNLDRQAISTWNTMIGLLKSIQTYHQIKQGTYVPSFETNKKEEKK